MGVSPCLGVHVRDDGVTGVRHHEAQHSEGVPGPGHRGMGLHSSTSQLNLTVSETSTHPKHPLIPPEHPLNSPYTNHERTPYPTESVYVELKSERV